MTKFATLKCNWFFQPSPPGYSVLSMHLEHVKAMLSEAFKMLGYVISAMFAHGDVLRPSLNSTVTLPGFRNHSVLGLSVSLLPESSPLKGVEHHSMGWSPRLNKPGGRLLSIRLPLLPH